MRGGHEARDRPDEEDGAAEPSARIGGRPDGPATDLAGELRHPFRGGEVHRRRVDGGAGRPRFFGRVPDLRPGGRPPQSKPLAAQGRASSGPMPMEAPVTTASGPAPARVDVSLRVSAPP